MLKKLFIIFKIVVIFYLLYCMVKGMLTTIFVCLFNLFLLFIVDKIQNKIKYSDVFKLFIYLFLFGSLTLGEVYSLFNMIWYFDIIMHVLSTFIVSGLIYYILRYFNVKMNSLVLILFVFSFAMMIEGLWEITEFGVDRIFNKDMQKDTVITEIKSTLLSNDKKRVVRKKINYMEIDNIRFNGYIDIGLYDTMEDMVCGLGGSILFIVIGKSRKLF